MVYIKKLYNDTKLYYIYAKNKLKIKPIKNIFFKLSPLLCISINYISKKYQIFMNNFIFSV